MELTLMFKDMCIHTHVWKYMTYMTASHVNYVAPLIPQLYVYVKHYHNPARALLDKPRPAH